MQRLTTDHRPTDDRVDRTGSGSESGCTLLPFLLASLIFGVLIALVEPARGEEPDATPANVDDMRPRGGGSLGQATGPAQLSQSTFSSRQWR